MSECAHILKGLCDALIAQLSDKPDFNYKINTAEKISQVIIGLATQKGFVSGDKDTFHTAGRAIAWMVERDGSKAVSEAYQPIDVATAEVETQPCNATPCKKQAHELFDHEVASVTKFQKEASENANLCKPNGHYIRVHMLRAIEHAKVCGFWCQDTRACYSTTIEYQYACKYMKDLKKRMRMQL